MEFLETLEVIRQESADVQRMFSGEGSRSPSRTGRADRDPTYGRRMVEALTFVNEVYTGRRDVRQMSEALTTSDFPILFGDILDRQMLAEYRERTGRWERIAKRRVVRDFRGVKLFKPLTGLAGQLEEVGELAEYPESPVTEQDTQTITVSKMGKRVGISWETLVNDDIDVMKAIPGRLARMARRTEAYKATNLYVGTTGYHASLYSVANKNIVSTANGAATNNPPLTIASLTDALLVFGNQLDEDGNPIEHDAVTLVVPPALEVVANNIINATAIELTTDGGTVGTTPFPERRLLTANWLSKRVAIEVNPLIPLVATSNANTSWFLFANPNADREALVMAFLRGWEDPAVFIKSSNARRLGGGEVDPLDGDFDTDSVAYKVRHVIGTARVDPKATVASNGSGNAP